MTKKEQIIEMRNQGMTFQAIADEWGCSKQYVHQELNREESMVKKHKVIYKNILHWCVDNEIGIRDFCKKLSANSEATNYSFLTKETNDMKRIKEILKITGMTFEQAFGGTDCED